TGGNQMQFVDFIADSNRVTSVIAAREARHDIGFGCQSVGHAALSFIPPLRADNDRCRHDRFPSDGCKHSAYPQGMQTDYAPKVGPSAILTCCSPQVCTSPSGPKASADSAPMPMAIADGCAAMTIRVTGDSLTLAIPGTIRPLLNQPTPELIWPSSCNNHAPKAIAASPS